MSLLSKRCVPCEGGAAPLSHEEIRRLLPEVDPGWQVEENRMIRRVFLLKNFSAAMAFVGHVASVSEAEGHHPDIHIRYNAVELELSTHAIAGLSENDFILARKIDELFAKKS